MLKHGAREETEAALRGYCDAWQRGDLPAIVDAYADDMVLHYFGTSPLAGDHVGKPAVLQVLARVQERTNRRLLAILDVLAGDERGAILVRERFEREGRSLELDRLLVYRVRNGKLAECWVYDEDQRAVDEFLA